MKLTLRKILTVLPVALLAILFTGVMISCSNDSGSDKSLALLLGGNKQTSPNKEKPAEEVTEPVFNTRTEALDFIFGTDKLASTKITITRGQWNKLLEYYDINPSNEECVHAIDMGNFYRVPADKRDLNYDKYFTDGDLERAKLSEFNSNNTVLMDVNQVKKKLLTLSYIRDEIDGYIEFLDKTCGKGKMKECEEYLLRLKKLA